MPLDHLHKYFANRAIMLYLVALVSCILVFSKQFLPLLYMGFGLAEVLLFFTLGSKLTHAWKGIGDRQFKQRLFQNSLLIRLMYVVAIYYFYVYMTGKPFEFEAADSEGYHNEALWVLDMFLSGDLGLYFSQYKQGVSDSGFPLWLAFVYYFSFRSIMVARLINALAGAYTCVLIYRLARRNFGEEAGRISAVMAMLLPTLIYYCGLHTKETIMVFLVALFTERADDLLRSRAILMSKVTVVVLVGVSLFFFRTVLAVAAWFALFTAILFSSGRIIGSSRRLVYLTWFVVAALFVFSGRIMREVQFYVEYSTANQGQRLENLATREEANRFATYGSAAVFAPLMIVGPLPAMVETNQPNAMMIHGANMVRNIYAFFVVMALVVIYRNKMARKNVMILVLLFSYLLILTFSGFALSERFHMPAVPFLLVLAGYGVTQTNRQNVRYYVPYLFVIALLILAWNWFKLAGRGAL